MKILLLCLRSPFPPADGGTIAMYNMAMSLKEAGAQVKIIAFNTKKHFIDPSRIPESFTADFSPELIYLDASVRLIPAMLNLVYGDSYNVSRFNSSLFHKTLSGVLDREQFDIIQLESVFMTPYVDTIRKKSKAKIILRAHNVEFVIWQRLAESTTGALKKWYLKFLSGRLKKYESAIINRLDGIVALTIEDKKLLEKMQCSKPLLVSPIGLDTGKYSMSKDHQKDLAVVHLGSMDWLPNIEGVEWFLERVYPIVRSQSGAVQVYLAGKNMPENIFNLSGNGLHVDGRIDDAKKYLFNKQVMIVPLLSGGGMRVKIIEGLAMGKTIISTTIGAEGIKYENNKNIIIADTPGEFAEAIIKCISDPGFAFHIGEQAKQLASQVYDNKVIGGELLRFYQSLPESFSH